MPQEWSKMLCLHSRGERLPGQKRFSYLLSLCFPSPAFTLAQSQSQFSWAKQGSSTVQSWGVRKVLLGLCSLCPVWRERVKPLLLQTAPDAALFFMPLFDWANPHNSTNTTVCPLSGLMTLFPSQVGLWQPSGGRLACFLDSYYYNDLLGFRDLCSVFCTCHLFRVLFKTNSLIFSSEGNYTHRANWSWSCSG